MNKRISKLFAVLAVLFLLTAASSVGASAKSGSTTITAIVRHERTITLRHTAGGQVDVTPKKDIYDGVTVTFTVTPDEAYVISAVYLNGEDIKSLLIGNTYAVNVSCDIDFYAVFVPKKHTHEWIDGTVIKEATDTEDGEMTYTCAICGEVKHVVIPAKKSPQTGDSVGLILGITVSAGGLCAATLLRLKYRKKKNGKS